MENVFLLKHTDESIDANFTTKGHGSLGVAVTYLGAYNEWSSFFSFTLVCPSNN
jgi:hypothetical protein